MNAIVGFVACGLVVVTQGAFADPPTSDAEAARRSLAGFHGTADLGPRDDSRFTREQLSRIHRLEVEIMCGCAKENFSRTLSNCPDGCANPQKEEIRRAVSAGKSDQEIFTDMINTYGGKVRSTPPGVWGTLTILLPMLILLGAAVVGLVTVTRWRRRGVESTRVSAQLGHQVTEAERAAIEREIEGFR